MVSYDQPRHFLLQSQDGAPPTGWGVLLRVCPLVRVKLFFA